MRHIESACFVMGELKKELHTTPKYRIAKRYVFNVSISVLAYLIAKNWDRYHEKI